MMKKLLSAMASLALLTGACAMPVSAEETYLLGDVNADGVVDVRDAQRIVGYFNRAVILNTEHMWTEEQYAAADVNADGVVDTSDAACVLDYCVKRIITKGSQNSDIYFAKVAAGVEDYSLGDVNMDGVVDVLDDVEISYAAQAYGNAGKYPPYWTEGQKLLADVTGEFDNTGTFGEVNFADGGVVRLYWEYAIIVPNGVSPEEFFMDRTAYVSNEMLVQAWESEDLGPILNECWETFHHLFYTKLYGENYEEILNGGVQE